MTNTNTNTNEHLDAINLLATTAARAPRGVPHPMPVSRDPGYDFERLAEALADSLTNAAEDLMKEAHQVADTARRTAAEIQAAVSEQSRILADVNQRLKSSGEAMLEAHRKFSGA